METEKSSFAGLSEVSLFFHICFTQQLRVDVDDIILTKRCTPGFKYIEFLSKQW